MRIIGLAIAAALTLSASAFAQTFPNKAVTMVVPYPPGATANDIVGRFVAEGLAKVWGQTVTVENRGGANALIGTGYVARAPANGYTFLFTSGSFTMNPAIMPSSTVDPATELTPAAIVAAGEYLLVTGKHVRGTTVADFVAEAKKREMLWASTGAGAEFGARLFEGATGISMKRVPFKGTSAALTELLAGRLDFIVGSAGSMKSYIEEKQVTPLAVTGPRRSPILPDVPTIKEAGFPDALLETWWGIFVPSKTPPDIIEKINADVQKLLATQDAKDFLAKQAITGTPISHKEAVAIVDAEMKKFDALAKKHNIRVEVN